MRTRTTLLGLSVIALFLVLCGPGVVTRAAAGTPISSCMMITEPGAYELVQNLQAWSGDCLMVQADFVTIDLKGFGIFGSGQYGTAVAGMGRGLVVRGGTIYSFFAAIRGGDGLVVEHMRVVNNSVGVDASMGGTASVKDSVFNDNSQFGVSVTNGVVANNSFYRNGTGVSAGQFGWYPGSGATITNNTFSQNQTGIATQGAASIRNNTLEGGYTALSIACPAHIVGNTVFRAPVPLTVQNNQVWDCTFEHNSIRQF